MTKIDPNELRPLHDIQQYTRAYFTGDLKFLPRYIASIIESRPESKVQLNMVIVHQQQQPLVDAVSKLTI